jgi:hypothetical protein
LRQEQLKKLVLLLGKVNGKISGSNKWLRGFLEERGYDIGRNKNRVKGD